ncbi:MAG: HypC/HybG/HupF family hydrogenase formation chaperone [Ignisphaera sp.]
MVNIMCWGSPAVVVDVDLDSMVAKVNYGDGIVRDALIGIAGERISRGDIVVVHAGVVISKLSDEGVLEHIKFLEEVLGKDAKEVIKAYETLLELARSLRGEARNG